ncbi:SDR family oxidoreductase [Acetobacter estunensis]|uniref:SDR family NAD(P)-dependent oxidoreductase n=1 Tax=Acetobacter estunensis TaxID=104097 RepID=UPI001C2CF8E5|nr:SDR family NAD(P)-dependent oxidoreductase [Acetobacter estunensis]MBV1836878.1 SDR family NAD(P)-dependent oxidoreductase [Acetobacter estunensis]
MKANTLLITGAASGLGRALALRHARPGVTLTLIDCNAAGLADTAVLAVEAGAKAVTHVLDVSEAAPMEAAVRGAGPLDLVIACAGITGGTHRRGSEVAATESAFQVRRMVAVNLDGVLNTVLPAIDVMRAQAPDAEGVRGRIAAIASVAGVVSFPGTPSYCATKAAVDRFMVATGGNLKQEGVLLSSVVCSFIDTPMVAGNTFHMPGLTRTEKAVDRIVTGLARNERRIVFPRWIVAGSRFMDLLPPALAELYYLRQSAGQAGTMPEVTP